MVRLPADAVGVSNYALATSAAFHAVHFAVVLGVPALVLTILWIREQRTQVGHESDLDDPIRHMERVKAAYGFVTTTPVRPERIPISKPVARSPLLFLAALSAGAGIVHTGVISEHFDEFWLYGLFFIAAAAMQFVWAGLLARWPSRRVLALAAIGNGAIVLLWLASRTTGLPLGPNPDVPEAASAPDVVATLFEIMLATWSWRLVRFPDGVDRSDREKRLLRSRWGAALIVAASLATLALRTP